VRILFFGQCNALIMHQIFARFGTESAEIGLIDISRELREKGAVDYDTALRYQHVIYFPTEFGDDEHQAALERILYGTSTKFHVIPPLMFLGYFPGLQKTRWNSWSYRKFFDRRAEFDEYRNFERWALHESFERSEIAENVDTSNNLLMNYEAANECMVSIHRFISYNFLNKQLFLYPTHPSNFLYGYIASKIAEVLGIGLADSVMNFKGQMHPDAYTPILPVVAKYLNLGFSSEEYVLHYVMGERIFTINEWLKMLYFSADHTKMISPGWGGWLRCEGKECEIVRGQLIFVEQDAGAYKILMAPENLKSRMPVGASIELLGEGWDVRDLIGYGYDN
jgi:hypothetical protein